MNPEGPNHFSDFHDKEPHNPASEVGEDVRVPTLLNDGELDAAQSAELSKEIQRVQKKADLEALRIAAAELAARQRQEEREAA